MLKHCLVNPVNVNESSEKLTVYDSFELSSSEIELFLMNDDEQSSSPAHIDLSSDSFNSIESTSIYEESSDFSSSNVSENSEVINIPRIRDGLTYYYTNADQLLYYMDELRARVANYNYDIIVVTEVFIKTESSLNIDSAELNLQGYTLYRSVTEEKSRGVIIYVKNNISSCEVESLNKHTFKEHVWTKVNLNSNETLLIGGIYRSGSSSRENNESLLELLTLAKNLNCTRTVVLGDFNQFAGHRLGLVDYYS